MVVFGVFIPAEILVVLIPAICTVASSFFTWRISKSSFRNEIAKLHLENAYEKERDYNNDFAEMTNRVSVFIDSQGGFHYDDAIKAIEKVRVKSYDKLASSIDELRREITKYKSNGVVDQEMMRTLLEKAVSEKRESDRRNSPNKHRKHFR